MTQSNQLIKLIVAIFLVLIIAVLSISALEGRIEKKALGIYEKRGMLAALEKREDNYLSLKADANMVEKNLLILSQALPEEDNMDSVVSNLDNLAYQTSNSGTLVFDPLAAVQDTGTAKKIGFTAILTGNTWSFAQYLDKLQKLPYFIEISGVSISSEANSENGNSRLTLTARLYYKK